MGELRSQKYWRNRPPVERVHNTAIPKRFRTQNLETFKPSEKDRESFDLINKWVEKAPEMIENGQGLYLVGGTGSGKTHLAQAILKRVVYTNNICGMFVTAEKYIQMSYNEIKFGDDLPEGYEDPNTMKYLQEVYDIVVIDALGSERPTDFTKRTIASLIESRYHNQLTTIITSIHKLPTLNDIYGANLQSIIRSSCLMAPLKSDDYRMSDWLEKNTGK